MMTLTERMMIMTMVAVTVILLLFAGEIEVGRVAIGVGRIEIGVSIRVGVGNIVVFVVVLGISVCFLLCVYFPLLLSPLSFLLDIHLSVRACVCPAIGFCCCHLYFGCL